MDSRIIVEGVWLSEDGRRINYKYRATGRAKDYFDRCPLFYSKYDVDLRGVPDGLLMVPLIANLAPIAWFAGAELHVTVLDGAFRRALEEIKQVFLRDYTALRGSASPIVVSDVEESTCSGSRTAMLFSGGVDAYTTFFRHRQQGLELVSIHGADIAVDDMAQWQHLVRANRCEPLLGQHPQHHIEANLREFYSYKVNLLVPSNSWWGSVQHGLALNGLLAPLAAKKGYACVYIASSYTEAVEILWGSTPEIDSKIAWSGCGVIHDGYELRRVDKIGTIVSETKKADSPVNLRVCYSELNDGLNCSNCEKCFRTILGLSLFNADPNQYGFKVDSGTYIRIRDFIEAGFKTLGVRYFWWELHQRMMEADTFFQFSPQDDAIRDEIASALGTALDRPLPEPAVRKWKMALIANYPGFFKWYLKARRLFS